MAYYYEKPSRTFNEFLLIPRLSSKECTVKNVSLKTPISRFKEGETPLYLNIPVSSAIMQSVSGSELGVALARFGGISFVFSSQSIESQVEMIKKVKKFKAGFVESESNLTTEDTLEDVLLLQEKNGHSTIAITDNGTSKGKLLGIVTTRDYRLTRTSRDTKIKEFMTPYEKMVCGKVGINLSEANNLIWENKVNTLPIVDEEQNLVYLVFRKDYSTHKEYPNELLDNNKQLIVGGGINTHDFKDRIPALVEAGADILCIDSSDGFNEWQAETIKFVKDNYGDKVKIGAGNVVDKDGFDFLADAGADFIKVGIGGGSICITREQKGIGRGQATSVIEVAEARDEYYKKTGIYIPICSDGGIVQDYHIALALAMGADFVMLGRYFARFDESPGRKFKIKGNFVKEYWGEGANRARNWQRYSETKSNKLEFEEGVDSYVPYAGSMRDNLEVTLSKVKSTMCNCGCLDIASLQKNAKITLLSKMSLVEGGAHDVTLKEKNIYE